MLKEENKAALAALAEELGFAETGFLPAAELPFRKEFRQFCVDNVCGNYGANYSCPPACGTPEEMEDRTRPFSQAVILRSQWTPEQAGGPQGVKACKDRHNRWTRQFVARRREEDGESLVMAGGCCGLCAPCRMREGQPCPHPKEAWSCLSAYCVDVAAMAEAAGMDFRWDPQRVSFYSVYLIH